MEAADGSEEVVRRRDRRDGRALVQLYDRYGRLVYALVLRMVQNQAAAEDLVVETFLRARNCAPIFDDHKGALEPWLLAVARNRALDYVRSREGSAFEENRDPRLYAGLEAGGTFAVHARRIKQALAQLPANRRQAIDLACFDGLSPAGMAAKLGHPPDTVKKWLRSTLAELRTAMETEVGE